ncbi:hypothetical protein CABS01_02891 [Colletotrichum abscissum]|uniref:uncharacterized protein n=1 Tax=Colletotrichum abscissum TaxID=1671311 RepID=UPI0027D737CA|nr:uncharacterized protein CABS01_02891 [Colletotrichum abscissum]KAK1483155.1 hypothetical protein CABS01_02891 [Colletotrichum abscissum]
MGRGARYSSLQCNELPSSHLSFSGSKSSCPPATLDWLALSILTLGFRGGWHRPPIVSPIQSGFWLMSSCRRLEAFASASQARQDKRNVCSFSWCCLVVLDMDLLAVHTSRDCSVGSHCAP